MGHLASSAPPGCPTDTDDPERLTAEHFGIDLTFSEFLPNRLLVALGADLKALTDEINPAVTRLF